jgi:hypothetical protein
VLAVPLASSMKFWLPIFSFSFNALNFALSFRSIALQLSRQSWSTLSAFSESLVLSEWHKVHHLERPLWCTSIVDILNFRYVQFHELLVGSYMNEINYARGSRSSVSSVARKFTCRNLYVWNLTITVDNRPGLECSASHNKSITFFDLLTALTKFRLLLYWLD